MALAHRSALFSGVPDDLDSRTIAILLYLNAPAMVEDLNLLTMVRYFTFVSLADPSSSDASLTTELANRLEI